MGSKTKTNSRKNNKAANIQVSQIMQQLNEVDVTLFQMAVRMESLAKVLIEKEIMTDDEFRESVNKTAEKYIEMSKDQTNESNDINININTEETSVTEETNE